jgi:hypothetical protein
MVQSTNAPSAGNTATRSNRNDHGAIEWLPNVYAQFLNAATSTIAEVFALGITAGGTGSVTLMRK